MMKRTLSLLALVALLVFSATAFAGSSEKCNASTEACLKMMSAKMQEKGWLGVETEKTDSGHYRIVNVHDNSPAKRAGFEKGDILLALNGVELTKENKKKLAKAKKGMKAGKSAEYTIKRAGGKQQMAVVLGNVPFTLMAEWVGHHMLEHHSGERIAQN